MAEALAAVKALRSDARVLDLGCGNGQPITQALLTAGYRVMGIDSRTHARAIARQSASHARWSWRFARVSVRR